jgi:RHS repeat-associated protein
MKKTLLSLTILLFFNNTFAQDTRKIRIPRISNPEVTTFTLQQEIEMSKNITPVSGINTFNNTALGDGQNPSFSAEASMNTRFKDVSIDFSSGSMQLPIPIYTLNEGLLNVPITLNYNGAGVRNQEVASWCGLGWNLNAGGMITRVVKGLPDEGVRRNNTNFLGMYNHGLGGTYSPTQINDREADIFYVNLFGTTYKMYYSYNYGKFISVPYNDIKVIPTFQYLPGNSSIGKFTRFEVITPDGTHFYFGSGATEETFEAEAGQIQSSGNQPGTTSFNNQWRENAQTSVWYLVKIVSAYGQEIFFDYDPMRYSFYKIADHGVENSPTALCPTPAEVVKKINRVFVKTQSLARIRGVNTKIEFNQRFKVCETVYDPSSMDFTEICEYQDLSNPRIDLDQWQRFPQSLSNTKRLNEILIMENNASPKDTLFYKFNYGYFTGVSDDLLTGYSETSTNSILVGTTHHKRLRLEKIEFPNQTNVRFRYKGDSPSFNGKSRLDFGIDHWGYANGSTGNRFMTGLIPRDSEFNTCTAITSNRESDPSFAFFGSMDSVIFENKKSIAFEYELHQASNYRDENQNLIPIGGARIKSITNLDLVTGIKTKKNYDYTENNEPSGHLVLKPIYRYKTPFESGSNSSIYERLLSEIGRPHLIYSKVTETISDIYDQGLGKTVMYFKDDKQEISIKEELIECSGEYPNQQCEVVNTFYRPEKLNYNFKPTGIPYKTEIFNENDDTLSVQSMDYWQSEWFKSPRIQGFATFNVNSRTIGANLINNVYSFNRFTESIAYKFLLKSQTNKTFSQNGENPIIAKTEYFYDDEKPEKPFNYFSLHNQVVKNQTITSKGDTIQNLLTYPQDFNYYLDTTFVEEYCSDEFGYFYDCSYDEITEHIPPLNTSARGIFEYKDAHIWNFPLEQKTKFNNKTISAQYTEIKHFNLQNSPLSFAPRKTYSSEIITNYFSDLDYRKNPNDTIIIDTSYNEKVEYLEYNKYGLNTILKPFGAPLKKITFDNSSLLPILIENNFGGSIVDSVQYEHDHKLYGVSKIIAQNHLETNMVYDTVHKKGMVLKILDKNKNILEQNYLLEPYENTLTNALNLSTDLSKLRIIKQIPKIAASIIPNNENDYSLGISYFDGNGQNIQSKAIKESPTKKDLISSTPIFDSFGRPQKSILAVPSNLNNGNFENNTLSQAQNFYTDTAPFSEVSQYEPSPLSRPFKSIGPGSAFRPSKEGVQTFETGNFGIPNMTYIPREEFELGDIMVEEYEGNQLMKITNVDSEGNKTVVINDKEGNTLQTWVQYKGDGSQKSDYLITTNIYDDLNRLTFIIPPSLYNDLPTENDEFNYPWYNISRNFYDERNRNYMSNTLDAGFNIKIFNKLGQVVLAQNTRQGFMFLWEWFKYNSRGDLVMTGLLKDPNNIWSTFQKLFDKFEEPNQFEELSFNNNEIGYSKRSFPAAIQSLIDDYGNVNIINYYDNYLWNQNEKLNFKKYKTDKWSNAKGLLTGRKVRRLDLKSTPILTFGFSNDFEQFDTIVKDSLLAVTMYYDDKNRLIQTQSENRLGKINQTDFVLDFTGQLLEEKEIYRKPTSGIDSLIEIKKTYKYDHAGRKLDATHHFNGRQELLASYEYDELGRLINKNLNEAGKDSIKRQNPVEVKDVVDVANRFVLLQPGTSISGDSVYFAFIASGLQKVTYQYDIRGNLSCVNCKTNGELDTSKVFALKLDYHQDGRFFNGLLSKQTWLSDSVERSFLYDYDKANRLKRGVFSGQNTENYSLPKITYDLNGNVDSLQRYGKINVDEFGLIDDLKFTYYPISNALEKIDDLADPNLGFKDTNTLTDFTYNAQGDITSDQNKGITSISYNYMGLIDKVHFGSSKSIENFYTADGQKLKTIYINGSDTLKKDYIGNLIYINDTLRSAWHDEGRIIFENGSLNLPKYQYFINDHLGSTRVVFQRQTDSLFVAQRIDYGVTGDIISEFPANQNLLTHTFQGKEFQDGFGYDFLTRTYDPYTMRMLQVDGANQFASGYVGMGNNPVMMVDPDGQFAFVPVLLAVGKAVAIGAGIGGVSYSASVGLSNGGFNNWNWNQFGKSVGIGAISGGVSFGIGSAASAIGGVGGFAVQTAGHAAWGGVNSVLNGGQFWSGAASGTLGNIAGNVTSNMKPVFQIGASALVGGVGAELAGDDFWRGAAIGGIVAGANHLMHLPIYEYNGRVYNSKDELYFAILQDQAMEQFGITDIIGLAAALDGTFPSIDKPFTTPGSSSKTSYASKYGSKLFPQKMPMRLPTHLNKSGKVVYTKVLGRFAGRLAGPVGWGLLAYDVGNTFYNTQKIYNSIISR